MSISTEGIKPEPQHGSDAPDEGRAPEILSVGTKLADEAAAIFEAGSSGSKLPSLITDKQVSGGGAGSTEESASLVIEPLAELQGRKPLSPQAAESVEPKPESLSLIPLFLERHPAAGKSPESSANAEQPKIKSGSDNGEQSPLPAASDPISSLKQSDARKISPAQEVPTSDDGSAPTQSLLPSARRHADNGETDKSTLQSLANLVRPANASGSPENGSLPEPPKEKLQPSGPALAAGGLLSNLFGTAALEPPKENRRPHDSGSGSPESVDNPVKVLQSLVQNNQLPSIVNTGNIISGAGAQVTLENGLRPSARHADTEPIDGKLPTPVSSIPLSNYLENPGGQRNRPLSEIIAANISGSASGLANGDSTPPRKPVSELEPTLSNLLRQTLSNSERETAPLPVKPEPQSNLLSNILEQLAGGKLVTQIQNLFDDKERAKPSLEKDKELLRPFYITAPAEIESKPPERVSRENSPVQKLEMQSAASQGDDRQMKSAQRLEEKLSNLLSVFSELKPMRLNEATTDSIVQRFAASREVMARQDLPLVPTLLRMADLSVEFKRGSLADKQLQATDPVNANISSARRLILAEAMSLKDLIAAGKGELPGSGHAVKPGLPAGIKSLDEQIFGIRHGLMPNGKLEPSAQTKGFDGKLDTGITGLKGAELLDTLKDGSKIKPNYLLPEGKGILPDRKDSIDKKDEIKTGKEELTVLVAADMVKSGKRKEKDDKDKSDKKDGNKDQETRRKYIVKDGDTLESIAATILRDSRFSLLIEMINRGYIRYKFEGANKIALLRVGQVLWLPSAKELQVHRAIYFGNGVFKSEPVAKVPEAPTTRESEAELESALPQLELSESCRENTAYSVIQDFLRKLREFGPDAIYIDDQHEIADQELPLVAYDEQYHTEYFDAANRFVIETSELADGETKFTARLEKEHDGQWKTTAHYESVAGRSVRFLHKSNGARSALQINIPESIVREMAIKDFRRNWQTYSGRY